MKLTLAERLLYITVKLSGFSGQRFMGRGTGFFWALDSGNHRRILVGTNKHVIEGCDRLEIVFHLEDISNPGSPSGAFLPISVQIGPTSLFMHPNSDVDICLISFTNIILHFQQAGTPLFLEALNITNIPTQAQWANFDAIEEVLMLGYPSGLYDEANNHPIVRRGITATAMNKNYSGKPEFMVDMACFPGSSGSPVFIKNIGYLDRGTGIYMADTQRFFFLGILYAGPTITNEGEIRFGTTASVEIAAMMHLGQVIRSSEMRALEGVVRTLMGL